MTMTSEEGLAQVAPENTCETAVAPRKRVRTRARGATNTKSPAALAAGNGHNQTTVAAVVQAATEDPIAAEPARKPRRRYHRVVVGGIHEISDGFVRRWAETTDEWGRPTRERLTDEDGFPTAEWEETSRFLSDSRTVVRFPVDEFPRVPSVVFRRGQMKVLPPLMPEGTKPNPSVEWFRPVPKGHPDREAFEAKRAEWLAGLPAGPETGEVPEPPKPAPKPVEQWFVVALPPATMQNPYWGVSGCEWGDYVPPDAREHFPEGWACRLIQPQPAYRLVTDTDYNGGRSWWVAVDPYWVYVQFPVHYWILDAVTGRWRRLTDQRGRDRGDYHVACGMWVPRWCLKLATPAEARPVYDWLVAAYRQALAEAGW